MLNGRGQFGSLRGSSEWGIYFFTALHIRKRRKRRGIPPTPSLLGVVNVLLICKSGYVVQLLQVGVLNNHPKDLLSSSFMLKGGV